MRKICSWVIVGDHDPPSTVSMSETLQELLQKLIPQFPMMTEETNRVPHPDILQEHALALCTSCSQPWFEDVPPKRRQRMLDIFLGISQLTYLPFCFQACESCQPGTSCASTYTAHMSLPSAATNWKSVDFRVVGAAAKTSDAHSCPLTATAICQSAALTTRMVALRGWSAITYESSQPLYSPLMLGSQAAQHISNSQWTDSAPASPVLLTLMKAVLTLLRRLVKEHQQQKKSAKAALAASTCLEILHPLLRPGTQVGAYTAEALYTSGELLNKLQTQSAPQASTA